jgi:ectoine hydroxylase-related dioxygenase (phytanoyl-CoA dioxygenase family)
LKYTPAPMALDDDLAALSRDGYVILRDVLPPDVVARMRARIDEAIARDGPRDVHLWDNLTSHDEAFRDMATHPRVLALAEALLGPDCVLSGTIARTPTPGAAAQNLHRDTSFWSPSMAAVDACLGLTALFALDPFRADNGATVALPGTHRLDAPATGRPVPIELPAGACLVFDLRLLHGGGANVSGELRRAVFAMYVRSWVKPMVDGPRSTPPEVARRASPTLRRLLGFERQPVHVLPDGRWEIVSAPGATSFYGQPEGHGVYG